MCKVGLGNSTIVIHCRDSRSTIVIAIVCFTIMIFEQFLQFLQFIGYISCSQ